jgi:hypothetical protein
MFSVIIPTMWKSIRIWGMFHRLHHSDFVDEIIVIDNAKEDRPNSQLYSKVRLIEQEENIFVNPAWNLGVKECRNENICILNDDVTFNVDEVFNVANLVLLDHPTSCLGVHPISYRGYAGPVEVEKGSIIGEGWGCCIFLKKDNWVDIPEELKIWFGDNWIIKNHEKSFSAAFQISTEMSTTSDLEELSSVIKHDLEEWRELNSSPVKIGISSNVDFYEKTIPICVKSIIDSGFDPSDIYVFVGGYGGDYEIMDVGFNVKAYKCPHNSFDFTSVVSIIEMGITDYNWFLLHDTIEVDSNFKEILDSQVLYSGKRVNRFPSMSMGSYDKNSFSLAESKIDVIKNISKDKCVEMEDEFTRHLPNICSGFEPLGVMDVYGNGVERFVEYYREAGIKKNKANNGTKTTWITDL